MNPTPMTVLEGLHAARDRLENRRYVYSEWTACTCGHVYKAATGKDRANSGEVIYSGDDLYRAVLARIVTANHLEVVRLGMTPSSRLVADAYAVSEGTEEFARTTRVSRRRAAVALVERAIAVEEVEQEAARLEVLDQARRVVDSAEVPVDGGELRQRVSLRA